jgi:hypothetical protein
VSRSYAAAARAVGGRLLPAGDAWREAWKQDARLALYGADAFHASLMGSQLAALTIFQGLTGQPPTTLPFANLTAEQTAVVRQAASGALTGIRQACGRPGGGSNRCADRGRHGPSWIRLSPAKVALRTGLALRSGAVLRCS